MLWSSTEVAFALAVLALPSLNAATAVCNILAPSIALPQWGPSLWPVLAVPGKKGPPSLHCTSEVGG